MNKNILVILISVLVCLLIAGVVFYYLKVKPTTNGTLQEALNKASTLPDVGADKIIGNPLDEVPSTNPMEKVANPFEDSYKNPFAE